jgi:hypothetical protein
MNPDWTREASTPSTADLIKALRIIADDHEQSRNLQWSECLVLTNAAARLAEMTKAIESLKAVPRDDARTVWIGERCVAVYRENGAVLAANRINAALAAHFKEAGHE